MASVSTVTSRGGARTAVCVDAARLEGESRSLRRALEVDPDEPGALTALAGVYSRLNRPAELVEACRAVVASRPGHFEAHHRMGEALGFLGRSEESRAAFAVAAALDPGSPSAHSGLGNALVGLGRLDEAAASFRRALALHPAMAEAHRGLGLALARLGRPGEGLAHLDEAVRLRPDLAAAHNSRGYALHALGRYREALDAYDQAVALAPLDAETIRDRAIVRLLTGDYRRGWPEYESRWRAHGLALPGFDQPPWRGEPVVGRTVLLVAEQGVGDVLQFVRYAAMVKARGASVAVQCAASLIPLLGTCPGIDRLVDRVEPGAGWFDTYAPLMNLPSVFGTTPETVPAPIPYLAAEPDRRARWRARLATSDGFRVGVVWQGNPAHARDADRSFPLAALEPLARVAGARLISLQKGHGADQVAALADRFRVVDLGDDLDAGPGAFLDTAAVMANLDLVVTADTSAAHLAGALGVPVWVALPRVPVDWRWMVGRDDSPWYPTARLFRQEVAGDWGPVFDRMASALAGLVAAIPRPTGPILVETAPGELVDKITILAIKSERIADPAKLANVRAELALLTSARDRAILPSPDLDAWTAELRAVNEAIWDVEDLLRRLDRDGDFGPAFVEAARSVYRNNDRRAAIKRAINDRLGSRLIEEKSHGAP